MKFEKNTIEILKNFSTINTNILIKPGNILSTLATAKNIMATAKIKESFDKEFGLFNLNEFLGVLSLFDDPDIDLNEGFMTIYKGKNKVKYVYANPSILVFPQKELKMPSVNVQATLSESNLSQITKSASVLGVPDVAITVEDGVVIAKVYDKKNPSSNTYIVELEADPAIPFVANFKVENLKIIADEYKVEISSKNIARFTGKKIGVVYYIAAESDSSFE
jgi:hypothetical protein